MKQKEFFGKGEKHVYVRKGDNGEILVTKTKRFKPFSFAG